MGDRFYMQQAGKQGGQPDNSKPKRKLKADHVAELNEILNSNIKGLDKLTIPTIEELKEAINVRLKEV